MVEVPAARRCGLLGNQVAEMTCSPGEKERRGSSTDAICLLPFTFGASVVISHTWRQASFFTFSKPVKNWLYRTGLKPITVQDLACLGLNSIGNGSFSSPVSEPGIFVNTAFPCAVPITITSGVFGFGDHEKHYRVTKGEGLNNQTQKSEEKEKKEEAQTFNEGYSLEAT